MFFIRTEESIEDAQKSLERGRSVRRWAFIGCSPWEHLAFAIPDDEKLKALETYGYDIDADSFDMDEIIHSDLFADCDEEKLARILNLEPCKDGYGYAEFLPGLCSLEEFDHEPNPSECSQNLQGELFAYLVCFEGEPVGIDPDEEWQLFRPTRIVWVSETGSKMQRQREI
jgi:hypothetical protein